MMGMYRCKECEHIFTEYDIERYAEPDDEGSFITYDGCPCCKSSNFEEDGDLEEAYEMGRNAGIGSMRSKLHSAIRIVKTHGATVDQMLKMMEECAK